MSEYLGQHWFVTIVVTIILGALGSALWEYTRPYWSRIGNTLFSIITLGLKSRRDQVYKDAARGYHEAASFEILLIIYTFFVAIAIGITAAFYLTPALMLPNPLTLSVCDKKEVAAEKRECILEQRKENVEPTARILGILALFSSVMLLSNYLSMYKTNILITRYNRSLRLIRPYIDEKKFYLLEQEFALVKDKEDYDLLMTDMVTIFDECKKQQKDEILPTV